MSITGGLPLAVDRAVATRCDTFQIFTKSSGQWRGRPLVAHEVEAFKTSVNAAGVGPVIAHASYLINVASPDATLRRRSTAALKDELERADALNLAGVVLHPGAYTTSDETDGLKRIADSVTEVLAEHPAGSAQLLLEHTAGQGTVLGHRFEHLATIIDGAGGSSRLGVCLDTCHLVAAGYDIISPAGYDAVFTDFDDTIGLGRLSAFHVNDSKTPLGSRLDRHEHIGEGCLGTAPFQRLLNDERFRMLPMILETAKTAGGRPTSVEPDPLDLQNLTVLRSLGHVDK